MITSSTSGRSLLVFLPVLILAWLASASLQIILDRTAWKVESTEEIVYLPPSRYLKAIALSYDDIAADLMWIRTVQEFGKRIETGDPKEKTLIFARFLDAATALDPHFFEAYKLGALYLSLVREYERSIAVYERGIAENPDNWELPSDLGRMYYLELKDYKKALYWWERTAKFPGHPTYIPRFVARLYAQTGHVETAIELWTQIYNEATNDWIRNMATEEIKKLRKQLQQMDVKK